MGIIINTVGVELKAPSDYIKQEGRYLLKIKEIKPDGFESGADKFKVIMEGVLEGTKEPLLTHIENFSTVPNMLWKIKVLEIALQAPEVYDIDDFIGRYVIANIKSETYTKKTDGTQAVAYKVKSWEYSKFNDKLAPIPQAKEIQNASAVVDVESDEEMPF